MKPGIPLAICASLLAVATIIPASPAAAQTSQEVAHGDDPGAHLYGAGHIANAGLNLIFAPLGILNGTYHPGYGYPGSGSAGQSSTSSRSSQNTEACNKYGLFGIFTHGCPFAARGGGTGAVLGGRANLEPGRSLTGGAGEPTLEIVR